MAARALLTALSGSLRSPKMMAWCPAAAQASAQAVEVPPLSQPVDAQIATLHAPLAARGLGQLLSDDLMDEGPRLVGAGHHAVAAADTGVPIHHDDAIGPLERGPGGADVHAGRVLAVLAHHRQIGHMAPEVVLHLDLADPDRLLQVPLGLGRCPQASPGGRAHSRGRTP